jgi:hypothetical protein
VTTSITSILSELGGEGAGGGDAGMDKRLGGGVQWTTSGEGKAGGARESATRSGISMSWGAPIDKVKLVSTAELLQSARLFSAAPGSEPEGGGI